MDSNVSKKTYLHKFFKLRFNSEKASLSVRELLRYKLGTVCNLFQHSSNFTCNPQFLAETINSKIALLHPSIESISSNLDKHRVLLSLQPKPIIVYISSLALLLASNTNITSKIVAEELVGLLILPIENIGSQLNLNLYIETNKSGIIYFCLDAESIAIWLEKSLTLIDLNTADELKSLPKFDRSDRDSLFPVQYIHARCCNLLSLGEREKISISKNNSGYKSWLNAQGDLWLDEEAEIFLLRQLFLVTDLYTAKSIDCNWQKLALNLSQLTAVFLAECQFLGEIKQKTPQKAIARLKLIAITQYWLQQLLMERLNLTAPTSL